MLDDQTMRIVLGGVTLTVLLLFYLGVYRPTRSRFCAWWTLALVSATCARLLLLVDHRELRVVTHPAAVMLAVVGITCVWFATRSLRRERLPTWLLGAAPVVILVLTGLGNAAGGIWAGNTLLFFYMAALFVAGSVETWLAWRAHRSLAGAHVNREPVVALMVTAVAGTVLAAYYALRAATQVVIGLDNGNSGLAVGSGSESVILLVCLVAVTFSVSAVAWDQHTQDLRRRAMHDDLTGLLGRTEFRVQAERAIAVARLSGADAVLVVADLDHFKQVNDAHGHAAGDAALVAFAGVLKEALRPGEVAGRQGGDEFGVVLLDTDHGDAFARLMAIREEYAARASTVDFPLPTVSCGVAGLADGGTVAEIYARADLALYRAKAEGRNRAVRYVSQVPRQSDRVASPQATQPSVPPGAGIP